MNKRPTIPRGGGLFGDAEPERRQPPAYQANVDGGSRGNPGPAAYGVVIRDAAGEIVARLKKYIGQSTNNVAEYFALIAALDYAENRGIRAMRILSDSELMVKQMRGQYKVKSEDLKPLFERARKMSQALELFRIEHIYREQNSEADALVNQAMDETSRRSTAAPTVPLASAEKSGGREASLRLYALCKDGKLHTDEPVPFADGTHVEILLRVRK